MQQFTDGAKKGEVQKAYLEKIDFQVSKCIAIMLSAFILFWPICTDEHIYYTVTVFRLHREPLQSISEFHLSYW